MHYRAGESTYRSMRGSDGNPFLSATALELFSFNWPSCHLTSLVICLAWLFSVILYVMSWNKTKMLDKEKKKTLQGLESFLHLIFPSRKKTEYYLDNSSSSFNQSLWIVNTDQYFKKCELKIGFYQNKVTSPQDVF